MTKFDIIVIGAGLVGLSSAYHLQKCNPNKKILLIERLPRPAQANSGRSAAMFRNTFTSVDNLQLADTSIDFYLNLQQEQGVDLGIRLIGYLWLVSENQTDQVQRHLQKMVEHRVDVKQITVQELKEIFPQVCTHFNKNDEEAQTLGLVNIGTALFGKKCGSLDPDLLAEFYMKGFLQFGGQASFNTNVTDLIIEPDEKLGLNGEPFVWQEARIVGVRVSGELEGDIRASRIVLATGAWANELLDPRGIDGRIKVKKRQLFKVDVGQNKGLSDLLSNRSFNSEGIPPFVILPKSGIYIKPVKEECSFWVGCEDEINREFITVPDANLDTYKAERRYYEFDIHPVLSKYLPSFKDVRPSSMWAGLYGINTLDYLPYVFMECGAIIVCGDSGSGVMKADALGRIVDAMYREGENATAYLYPNIPYDVRKLSYRQRNVEREEWVI
jgi:glycine/D-amino acid oxidase-like deaminating enzyme